MANPQLLEYRPGSLDGDDPLHGELMELNIGPQHPATHGVLRLKVTLDGEVMKTVEPVVLRSWRSRCAFAASRNG